MLQQADRFDGGLESRISALEALSGITRSEDRQEGQPVAEHPYWEATFVTGITTTAGISDDWDPRFDAPGVANRCKFKIATTAGELSWTTFNENIRRRFEINWYSDAQRTVRAYIMGSRQDDAAGGYIQLKLNGRLYERLLDAPGGGTVSYLENLELIKGNNHLVICTQDRPFTTMFCAALWDDVHGRWTKPTGNHGYVNV